MMGGGEGGSQKDSCKGEVCCGCYDGEGRKEAKNLIVKGGCVMVMMMEEWDGVEQKVLF